MTSLWVLIIITSVHSGYTVSSIELDNKAACEAAKEYVTKNRLRYITAECFRKEK